MKILLVLGAGEKDNPAAALAEVFRKGALEAGHETAFFPLDTIGISGCLGCLQRDSYDSGGSCVLDDGYADIYRAYEEAALLVLAAPLFYYGLSAQVKVLLAKLAVHRSPKMPVKSAVLLIAAAEEKGEAVQAAVEEYRAFLGEMGLADQGIVIATAAGLAAAQEEAYRLSRGL